jgi:hypothetical protein
MPRGKPNYIDPVRKGATFNVRAVERPPKEHVVYFVQAATGQIKIGTTAYLERRLAILRGQSPVEITLLANVSGKRVDEYALHTQFAAHRLHGEWFEPHPDILAEIDRVRAPFPHPTAEPMTAEKERHDGSPC